MKLERVISIEKRNPDEKGIDRTRHLTGDERVPMLEDLRKEMAKAAGYEYPQRLQKVIRIVKRQTR